MSKPPGGVGFPVIGDKSVEFYRDAIGFVDRKLAHYDSRIFTTRFLNQGTVFVASSSGVQELLNDEHSHYEMGYKQFMFGIFGDNVVFGDGEEAQYTRNVLQKVLMSDHSVYHFEQTTERIMTEAMNGIDAKNQISIYPFIKKLFTEICISVFLDIDFKTSSELAENILSLTTSHWHGIISVPVNLTIPLTQQKSSYGKALIAKDKLIDIIESKLSDSALNGFTAQVREAEFKKKELAKNHVLLFTSALVPKALASIITSFVLFLLNKRELVQKCRESDDFLECVLLETQRLKPPFVGGRRIAKQDCNLQDLKISKGHALLYMTYHAQRDASVFHDPDEFIPSRWMNKNKHDRDKLFLFGGGPRCCIGQHLVNHLIKTAAKELLERFDWTVCEGQSLEYKWLPVARPKVDVMIQLIPRQAEL